MKAMPVMAGRCWARSGVVESAASAKRAANLMRETVADGICRVKAWNSEILNRMKKRVTKPVSAETIACMVDKGRGVSRFFTNAGRIMQPVQRVNVDFA